jgi:hypothetical protein
MDPQATDAPSTRPFAAADHQQTETETGKPAAASPVQRGDSASRVREPGVSDDGQLVEAGYGHGV